MSNIRSDSVDRLFQTMMRLESIDDFYAFFEDLCTVKEIKDMAQRLDAAFLLDEGVHYQTISQEIGISTATISRVSKCLKCGSGYRNAIDAIDKSKELTGHENQ